MNTQGTGAFMSTEGLGDDSSAEVLRKQPQLEKLDRSVRCETCKLSLNSPAQAHQHYSGKAHFKKLKSLGLPVPEEGKEKLAKVATARMDKVRTSQNQDAKQQQPQQQPASQPPAADNNYSVSQSQPPTTDNNYSSAGNQNPAVVSTGYGVNMDPVSAAVYNNMSGTMPLKRKLIPCDVCNLTFNSQSQMDAHMSGTKHAKKMQNAKKPKIQNNVAGAAAQPAPSGPDSYHCSYCNISVNSQTQFQAHLIVAHKNRNGAGNSKGTKHKRAASGGGGGAQQSFGAKINTAVDEIPGRMSGMFHCAMCDISVLTAGRLQQHVSGSNHKQVLSQQQASMEQNTYPAQLASYQAQEASQSSYPAQQTSQSSYPAQQTSQSSYPAQQTSQSSYPAQDASQSSYPAQQASYPAQQAPYSAQQAHYPAQDASYAAQQAPYTGQEAYPAQAPYTGQEAYAQ